MKVIDLLNKIAKGETPETIKYDGLIYYKEIDGYYTNNELKLRLSMMNDLNDEVEIIEEDIELKKIDSIRVPMINNDRERNIENITETLEKYWFSINELIDKVKVLSDKVSK